MGMKRINNDPDAGRVRTRMIADLQGLVSSLTSELEAYGHLFTGPELKRLAGIKKEARQALRLLDRNEDRRNGS